MTRSAIYTLGYARWTLDQVATEVHKRDALLTDVRHAPQTSKPGFSRPELERRLGNQYLHVPGFGNVNYKQGPIELANPEEGLDTVLDAPHDPMILMCGCMSPEQCHRTVIANLLQDRTGGSITHLQSPTARRQKGLFDE